jgi:hypothetical protein
VASLLSAYNDAVAATTPTTAALTANADAIFGTAGNDAITATQLTYTAGDVIADSSTVDSDTLTVTATDDIAVTPVVTGWENVTFNLNAATTAAGTGTVFNVDVANITSGATISGAVTHAASTVVGFTTTNVQSGTTVASPLTLVVGAAANADITINATGAAAQSVTQTGTADDVTVVGSGTGLLTTNTTADENLTITAAGALTITDNNPGTAGTSNAVTATSNGTMTVTDVQGAGTFVGTANAGNITVGGTDFSPLTATFTTAAGDITLTDVAESTTVTATAVGSPSDATLADGDITVTTAAAATTMTLTGTGGIAITGADAVTAATLTAGQASTIEDLGAVKTLTLASTGATATTFTVKTGENDLNVVDNIVFTGSGNTTLAVDGTDLVAAAAATDGGTSAASVIASDTGTGTSRVAIQEAAGAALNLSALAVDEIAFTHTENSANAYTLASGATVVLGNDQTRLTLTASATAGNTATIVYEDDAAAADTTAHAIARMDSTNISNVTLQIDDTEVAAGVNATLINVGTANTLTLSGAGNIKIGTSVTANNVASNNYTGAADIQLVNTIATTFALGSGNDTVTGDGTASAYTIDFGGGVDTLELGTDYSGSLLTLSNLEMINATANAEVDEIDVDGMTLTVTGANDFKVSDQGGVGASINMANITKVGGTFTIDGGAGGDNITASAISATIINGLAGADIIVGGAGADTIRGGDGLDTLTGGGGADDFDIGEEGSTNYSTIKDFSVATVVDELHIDISAINGGNLMDTTGTAEGNGTLAIVEYTGAVALASNASGTSLIKCTATDYTAFTGVNADIDAFNITLDGGSSGFAIGEGILMTYHDTDDAQMILGYIESDTADIFDNGNTFVELARVDMTASDYTLIAAAHFDYVA